MDYDVVSLDYDQSHLQMQWRGGDRVIRIGPLRREVLSNDTVGGRQLVPLLERELLPRIGSDTSQEGWLVFTHSLTDVEFGCAWKALQQVLTSTGVLLSSTRPHRLQQALESLRHPPTIAFSDDGGHQVYVAVELDSFTDEQLPYIRRMIERVAWPAEHWLLDGAAPPDSATVVVQFAENGPAFQQRMATRLERGDFRRRHLILIACSDLDPASGQSRQLGLADRILDAGAAGVNVFDTVPDIQAFELLMAQMSLAMQQAFVLRQSLTGDELLQQILDRCQVLADLGEAEYREQQRRQRQELRSRTNRKPTA